VSEQRYIPQSRRGRLGGRVLGSNSRPVENAQVVVSAGPSHLDIAALTGPEGKFDFGPVVPGRYTLQVQAQNYLPQTADVTVRAGMQADATILLRIRARKAPRLSPSHERWEASEVPADDDEAEEV
jgi:hypothetical protein